MLSVQAVANDTELVNWVEQRLVCEDCTAFSFSPHVCHIFLHCFPGLISGICFYMFLPLNLSRIFDPDFQEAFDVSHLSHPFHVYIVYYCEECGTRKGEHTQVIDRSKCRHGTQKGFALVCAPCVKLKRPLLGRFEEQQQQCVPKAMLLFQMDGVHFTPVVVTDGLGEFGDGPGR